jgi:outer membrane immunogenic protein
MVSKGSYKDAPMAACAADPFAGKSLGVFVGYAHQTSDITDVDYYWGGETITNEGNGFVGGVSLGYDWVRCNTLFGVVADLSFLNADADQKTYYGDYNYESSIDWMATLRVRAGAVLDNTLFYLTGGIAFAGIDSQIKDYYYVNSWKSDDTRVGYVVGAGLEHMIKPRTFLTAEVLYADFGDESAKDSYYKDYTYKFDDEVFLAKIGLNFRFGGDRVEPLK